MSIGINDNKMVIHYLNGYYQLLLLHLFPILSTRIIIYRQHQERAMGQEVSILIILSLHRNTKYIFYLCLLLE